MPCGVDQVRTLDDRSDLWVAFFEEHQERLSEEAAAMCELAQQMGMTPPVVQYRVIAWHEAGGSHAVIDKVWRSLEETKALLKTGSKVYHWAMQCSLDFRQVVAQGDSEDDEVVLRVGPQ